MGSIELKAFGTLDKTTLGRLKPGIREMDLSTRADVRIKEVARMVADLAAADPITTNPVFEAIQSRRPDRPSWTQGRALRMVTTVDATGPMGNTPDE